MLYKFSWTCIFVPTLDYIFSFNWQFSKRFLLPKVQTFSTFEHYFHFLMCNFQNRVLLTSKQIKAIFLYLLTLCYDNKNISIFFLSFSIDTVRVMCHEKGAYKSALIVALFLYCAQGAAIEEECLFFILLRHSYCRAPQ